MFKDPRIGAIVFYVKDVARSEKFYRDSLGLKTRLSVVRHDPDAPEEKMLMASCGQVSLIFFEGAKKIGETPIVVFELERGIDTVVEQLAARGVQMVTPVSEAPGGWTADFVDPDRHTLSMYQPNTAPRR